MGPLILCCWSRAIPTSQKIKQIKSRSLLSFMGVASRSQLNWLWKTLWEALISNSHEEWSQSHTMLTRVCPCLSTDEQPLCTPTAQTGEITVGYWAIVLLFEFKGTPGTPKTKSNNKNKCKKTPLPLVLDLSVSPQLRCFYCSAKLPRGCQATWLQHHQSPACQPSAAVLIDLGSRACAAKRAAARASLSLFFIFSPLNSPKTNKQKKKPAETLAKCY